MMIAARLAGGNLFLPFLWWGGFWEQLGALGFFLRGFVVGGFFFFVGGGGCFGL